MEIINKNFVLFSVFSKSSMSGQYSFKGSQGPTVVGTKKDSLTTNGNGPPPLIYDPPDDENMNEIIDDDVNLTVVLPDGSKKNQTVKPRYVKYQ